MDVGHTQAQCLLQSDSMFSIRKHSRNRRCPVSYRTHASLLLESEIRRNYAAAAYTPSATLTEF